MMRVFCTNDDAPAKLSREGETNRQEEQASASITTSTVGVQHQDQIQDQPITCSSNTIHKKDALETISPTSTPADNDKKGGETGTSMSIIKTEDLTPAVVVTSSSSSANASSTSHNQRKTVRINDKVTLIPLLTSASFFRKTPKPTATKVTKYRYGGMMRSFRIVSTSAIVARDNNETHDEDPDENLVPKCSLWWTKEERREILLSNQKASREFKRYHPSQVRRANLVYHKIVTDCSNNSGDDDGYDHKDGDTTNNDDIYHFFQHNRLRQHKDANVSSTSTTNANSTSHSKKRKRTVGWNTSANTTTDDDETPTIYLPTHVRGLEWNVLPDAKRYRKTHARIVLKCQERFRELNDECPRKRPRKSDHDGDHQDHDGDEIAAARFSHRQEQQDVLLGQKAVASSRRSCLLARSFGKSDAIAARNLVDANRSSVSESPTPSLTSTTDESDSSCCSSSDEEDGDESDANNNSGTSSDEDDTDDDDSDSDDDDEDNSHATRNRYHPMSYSYSYSSSRLSTNANGNVNSNTLRRTFRPRMMPPISWR
uniref:Uncharacterized protein n=1 Tax=Pseudo-nitzschia australis TaxID=44445 RepID=A0A7S4ADT4_9STRA